MKVCLLAKAMTWIVPVTSSISNMCSTHLSFFAFLVFFYFYWALFPSSLASLAPTTTSLVLPSSWALTFLPLCKLLEDSPKRAAFNASSLCFYRLRALFDMGFSPYGKLGVFDGWTDDLSASLF